MKFGQIIRSYAQYPAEQIPGKVFMDEVIEASWLEQLFFR